MKQVFSQRGLPLLHEEHRLQRVNTTQWDVLVLDLDGTLLCSQGAVSEQNLHALDSVRAHGIEVVVATGRSFAECKHILQSINHSGVCITAGGSQMTCSEGEAIARDIVEVEVVREVTEQVLRRGHRTLLLKDATTCEAEYVLVGDAELHVASTWWFKTLGVSVLEVSNITDDPWPEDTLRVGAVADECDLLPIANHLEKTLSGRAKLQHWSAVTCSEATGSSTHLLEVFSKEVSKWTMLERHLGKQLNRARIAAIGDGLNDVEMLQEVGLAIAMENANEFVQQHADVLAGHHDNHGFAGAMHQWIIPSGETR
jgi:5-amino-6-(5-phospho-D-ribitylamino)uracil phosphatase